MTKVSYQGVIGCFSSMVCEQCFPEADCRGSLTFGDAMQSVQSGEADIAVIPVENSTAGRVMEVYNILPESGLSIIGEYFLPIHHCLMMPTRFVRGLPPQNLTEEQLLEWKRREPDQDVLDRAVSRIVEVRSHTQGLAQCRNFLMKALLNARLRETWDTAGAARDLSQDSQPNVAVLAPAGAVRYGMTILRENVEDDSSNTTRFLFLRKTPLTAEEIKGPAITTMVFQTKHVAGALVQALKVFEKYNLNMTKLETYMTGSHHSKPVFYIDVAMNQFNETGQKALEELRSVSAGVQVLGTYEASPARKKNFGFPELD